MGRKRTGCIVSVMLAALLLPIVGGSVLAAPADPGKPQIGGRGYTDDQRRAAAQARQKKYASKGAKRVVVRPTSAPKGVQPPGGGQR